MPSLIEKALAAKRESKHVEFKEDFDPSSGHDWCESIKDIVALANSGGGILVFGLSSQGTPIKKPLGITGTDPADIGNRLRNYVGSVDLEFEVIELTKDGNQLIALLVQPALLPIVFARPGTYPDVGGKQRTAFSQGTIYFRHGAKSEPGSSDDIRKAFERQIAKFRREWTKNVRQVMEAPAGTQLVPVASVSKDRNTPLATRVHLVKDRNAVPVRLTRDREITAGTFLHEEVSDAIFDEINNVLDVNRVLAKGRDQFLLGQEVYYRVYAERSHVKQPEDQIALLFRSALSLYAPSSYWLLALSDHVAARILMDLYLRPVSPQIHALLRYAILFGNEFSTWLLARWHAQWGRFSQPPKFYWTYKDMCKSGATDPRLAATRSNLASAIGVDKGSTATAGELISRPEHAAVLLSRACMQVFENRFDASVARGICRSLDCFAYGPAVMKRGAALGAALRKLVGDRRSSLATDDRDPE